MSDHNTNSPSLAGLPVLIKGAGEMASGVAYRLHQAGFRVALSEVPAPLAVRRAVSFCEAVYDGTKTVEGLTARLAAGPAEFAAIWDAGELPVLVDPDLDCRAEMEFMVIIDALLAKRNTGLSRDMAPLTIGLGPGFTAPREVHLAIETMRGHNLGRLIYQGSPAANTGEPGAMAGYTYERVLRSPGDGVFETETELGQEVEAGQAVAHVAGQAVQAQIGGVLRGLIRPGARVRTGWKVGDVDPRGQLEYLNTISEKARAIGGSVLEGILHAFNK